MASASEQRRAAEYQQAQTRLQTILGEQQADRNSARERQLLGLIGTEAGSQFDRGISDFQRASTTPFSVGRNRAFDAETQTPFKLGRSAEFDAETQTPFRLGRSAEFDAETQTPFQLQRSKEFDAETTGTPEAVTRLQQLIREQALPEQQRALAQGKIALQQAGVRGPEAALMQQRQQNRMQTDLANRAEQIALQQALSDRGTRQQFAAQRGMQELAQQRSDRGARQQFAAQRGMQEAEQARADRGARQEFAAQRGMQQIAQARADRAAQQQFARDRAIGAQEKSFGRNVTAEGRQRFSNESVTEAALRPRTWASLQDQSKRGEMYGGKVDLGKNQTSVNINKKPPQVSQPVSKPVNKPVSQPVNINFRRNPRTPWQSRGW